MPAISPSPSPPSPLPPGREGRSRIWGCAGALRPHNPKFANFPLLRSGARVGGWGLIIVVLAYLISACTGGRPNLTASPTSLSSTPLISASPSLLSPTPLIPATPTEAPPPPALPPTHYTLTAVLNYALHHLVVDEGIEYTNRSPQALDQLLLMAEPVYFPGTFDLKGMAWGDGTAITDFRRDGSRIILPLPQPLEPGEAITLSLNYELSLPSPVPSPDLRPIPFGYTTRQTNLVDWYPYIPPYKPGEGWLAHSAGYFGEHQVYETADFDVSLHILDERGDLIVAASAPAHKEGDWRRYEYDDARNFALSVSPEYRVYTATVGTTTVISYAFGFHETAGQAVLQTTAEALELYNRLYGPYPRPLFSAIEADFLDGMEYDGLYFLSNGFYNLYQGQPGDYLVSIAAHETAHQWFYAQVANDQALEPWLDEALCTYSERLFYENKYPDALKWWWDYRVNYYQPQGWVDGSIYNPAGYRPYRDAVYLNGALFLEALRKQVGDEAFFAFIKDYVAQMSGKIATRQDFFRILGEHTTNDLSPLLKVYFQAP